MQKDPIAPAGGRDFLGSGLTGREVTGLLAVSIAVFLLWNGPLWIARPGTSHLARILISYAIVVPLAGLVLARRERWSWTRLLGATALLWSAKLLLTATLYTWLARGSAVPDAALVHDRIAGAAGGEAYMPAAAPPRRVELSGRVVDGKEPVVAAVVRVVAPPPGLPLDEPHRLHIEIHSARYAAGLYLAAPHDYLVAVNHDAVLHTLRFQQGRNTVSNIPLPPGTGPHHVALPADAGVYDVGCANHPGEQATLVIVDHPYAALTDARGHFALPQPPPGTLVFEVVRPGIAPWRGSPSPHAGLTLDVGANR
jgi:hypothetical protein